MKLLKGHISDDIYDEALRRFEMQVESAEEWRDVINTYFYRKTGIDDIRTGKYTADRKRLLHNMCSVQQPLIIRVQSTGPVVLRFS